MGKVENSEPALEGEKLINFRLGRIRQAMAEEGLPKLTMSGKSALEKIRKEMGLGAKGMKKEPEAHASDLVPAKIVERKTRKRKKMFRTPTVKRRSKKRAKYNTQEMFEKLAKAHQKIADSLKNDKRQSAKRRYHQVLAENFALIANGSKDEGNDELTRIAPLFKGALIITPGSTPPKYY